MAERSEAIICVPGFTRLLQLSRCSLASLDRYRKGLTLIRGGGGAGDRSLLSFPPPNHVNITAFTWANGHKQLKMTSLRAPAPNIA